MLLQPYICLSRYYFFPDNLTSKAGQNEHCCATRLLFSNAHLFHPLPGLYDFLFQPLAASCDNRGVPSDSLFLLPEEEHTLNLYSPITRWWQMAEAVETRAELCL